MNPKSKPKSKNEVQDLRRKILNLRRSLSSSQRQLLSSQAVGRFLESWEVFGEKLFTRKGFEGRRRHLGHIRAGIYSATQSELDLHLLEIAFRQKGYVLCFPRISDSKAKQMCFVEVSEDLGKGSDPQGSLGPYGIWEPSSHLPEVAVEELDLIFVPGVVFGTKGERIGRGGGYYDRFLAQAPNVLRVSLAFDFQVVSCPPQEAWDQSVHWIVTEKREVRMPRLEMGLVGLEDAEEVRLGARGRK